MTKYIKVKHTFMERFYAFFGFIREDHVVNQEQIDVHKHYDQSTKTVIIKKDTAKIDTETPQIGTGVAQPDEIDDPKTRIPFFDLGSDKKVKSNL